MVNAMGAIAILGFLVWALNDVMGPLLSDLKINEFFCMLERSNKGQCVFYICFKTQKFIPLNNQQETTKLMLTRPYVNNVDSPETTQKNTQIGIKPNETWTPNKTKITKGWIIGFTEGDGYFSTYNGYYGLECTFTLTQADPKVLHKVRNYFGFGSIFQDKKGYWRYVVRSQKDILTLIHFFNGKLILKKRILQFQKWVQEYNKKNNLNIKPILTPALFNLDNAWLTGFADADGSFSLLLQKRKDNNKYRMRIRFYLDQADALDSLILIQSQIGGTISKKRNKKFKNYDRLMIDTFDKANTIISYFNTFPPLTTSLVIRFIRYQRVFHWYQKKQWKSRISEINHLIQLNKRLLKNTLFIPRSSIIFLKLS
jgi:hypothetical protein